jgi:hypothetical protein
MTNEASVLTAAIISICSTAAVLGFFVGVVMHEARMKAYMLECRAQQRISQYYQPGAYAKKLYLGKFEI